jgi:hypothetical protein
MGVKYIDNVFLHKNHCPDNSHKKGERRLNFMDKSKLQEIREIIQSSNINLLIGSGLSRPFLPTLNDIEKKINEAIKAGDNNRKLEAYKEYFNKVMLPNINIVDNGASLTGRDKNNYIETFNGYKELFELIGIILLRRKSTILGKQANIFTTNIDLFMENALENAKLDYNDGFSGHLKPTFNVNNFNKSIRKRSLHYENISEIPVLNLIKLHGSLSWTNKNNQEKQEQIIYSDLEQIKTINKEIATDRFVKEFQELQIVNPETSKHEETVLNLTYYEMLRIFAGELEKENTVLFVMGFSMEDSHIRQITIRCADANPTLKIYMFCYEDRDCQRINEYLINQTKNKNIEIVGPGYDIHKIIGEVFIKIKRQEKDDRDGK